MNVTSSSEKIMARNRGSNGRITLGNGCICNAATDEKYIAYWRCA